MYVEFLIYTSSVKIYTAIFFVYYEQKYIEVIELEQLQFEHMTPYELGESYDERAIPYIIRYLKEGKDSEKRLAASAVNKFGFKGIFCNDALPYLIHNIASEKCQLRYYSLKALAHWPKESLLPYEQIFKDAYKIENRYYNDKFFEILLKKIGVKPLSVKNYRDLKNTMNEKLMQYAVDELLTICEMRDQGMEPQKIIDMMQQKLANLKSLLT